jgi:hypothetical protein
MFNVIFVLFGIPLILLAVIGLALWHFGENFWRSASGRPVIPMPKARVARFCDRLKNWVIEYDLD